MFFEPAPHSSLTQVRHKPTRLLRQSRGRVRASRHEHVRKVSPARLDSRNVLERLV